MYFIQKSILDEIKNTIGITTMESGGIIGAKDNVICAYYFDDKNIGNISEYIPDTEKLNSIIRAWGNIGIHFIGIVHSHANAYDKPSLGDKIYADNLIKENSFLERVLFPIVTKTNAFVKVDFYEYCKETKAFTSTEVKVLSNTK